MSKHDVHIVDPSNAEQIFGWFQDRGGITVWKSIDLSDPGKRWTCPKTDSTGQPVTKPSWQSASEPARTITDPHEVMVVSGKEHRRFHVALRTTETTRVKLTDASSRKLRDSVSSATRRFSKFGYDAWYEFDYDTQEAVIYVPDEIVPLDEWIETRQSV